MGFGIADQPPQQARALLQRLERHPQRTLRRFRLLRQYPVHGKSVSDPAAEAQPPFVVDLPQNPAATAASALCGMLSCEKNARAVGRAHS